MRFFNEVGGALNRNRRTKKGLSYEILLDAPYLVQYDTVACSN